MDRRRAMGVIGACGAGFTGVSAAEPAPTLKVSIVLPELYDPDGKLVWPPTLRSAGFGLRFFVVVENVSANDLYLWADGNSAGHGTLSFEVDGPDGKKSMVRRIDQVWTKNVLRAERLVPSGHHVRVVEYDPRPGTPAQWESFPFGPKNSRREVTLRAVFEQPKVTGRTGLTPWAGKVTSAACKVILMAE